MKKSRLIKKNWKRKRILGRWSWRRNSFLKETDPTKLGKSMVDTLNRKAIIGTLLMLMILPLISST